MLLLFLLLVGVRGTFCATDECFSVDLEQNAVRFLAKKNAHEAGVSDPQPYSYFGEHVVLVQFQSPKEGLCQVAWNIYGLLYNRSCSIETSLEMEFLHGDDNGIVLGEETLCDRLLKNRFPVFIRENKGVSSVGGTPRIKLEHLSEMRPNDVCRQWIVRSVEDLREDLVDGEIRIICDRGAFQSLGYRDGVYAPRANFLSKRRLKMQEEGTAEFKERMRVLADGKMFELKRQAAIDMGEIIVRCIMPSGQERRVLWQGWGVRDSAGRALVDFLLTCALQGISLGYTESVLRYGTFINDHVTKALRASLARDLLNKEKVSAVEGRDMVTVENLWSLRQMSWTVVPGIEPLSPSVSGACSITVAGITLEGLPHWDRWSGKGAVLPRCLLWGYDSEALIQKKPKDISWYEAYVSSDKVTWQVKEFNSLKKMSVKMHASLRRK